MGKDKTWVQAVVDPSLYPFLPGAAIKLWGHKFRIYPDKSLCLEMHNDFVSAEVRAGRVKVMDTPPPGVVSAKVPEPKKIEIVSDEFEFTMTAETYFGAGDINTLIEELGNLTIPKIKAFAKDRFADVTFPTNIKKDELLDEIRTMTDLEIIGMMSKESDETVDSNDSQE